MTKPHLMTATELKDLYERMADTDVDRLEAHMLALSAVPDDVARDVEAVGAGISPLAIDDLETVKDARAALSRLATAAARVPGLLVDVAGMGERVERAERAEARAESERDAAREERDAAQRDLVGVINERDAARQGVDDLKASETSLYEENRKAAADRERLTARVAELEREKEATRLNNEDFAKRLIAQRDELQDVVIPGLGDRLAATEADLSSLRAGMEPTRLERPDPTTLEEALSSLRLWRGGARNANQRALENFRRAEAAEARATAVEAKTEEWKRLAEHLEGESKGAFQRGYEKADADRDNTIACQSTTAPGLREAVGPKMEEVRRNLWSISNATPDAVLASITKAEAVPMLAAYDAPEPSVTHAQLAAVVEALEEYQRNGASDHADALGRNALEVLRRVTGGQVPETLPKARVVEVLATVVTRARAAAANTYETGDPLREALANLYTGEANGATEAAEMLGLTLPTGPGGGCENQQPRSGDSMRHLAQIAQSAEAQIRTLELMSESPDLAHIARCTASDGIHLCEKFDGHAFEHRFTRSVPTAAAPDPAAPDVVWEQDRVRVLADGTVEEYWANAWSKCHDPRATRLARALAEAKREAHVAVNGAGGWRDVLTVQEHLTKDAARKAAEDMRERAEQAAYEAAANTRHPEQRDRFLALGHVIGALPLEDK